MNAGATQAETLSANGAGAHSAPVARSTRLLFGVVVFVVAVAFLATAFDPNLTPHWQAAMFWLGIAAGVAAATAVGLHRDAGDPERLLALAALGAMLWLPYLLRSPDHPLFSDDLYHQQSLRLIAASGHTELPVTRFPIPGQFPGLELATLWLQDVTGLSLETLSRVVPLVVHVTVPLLVFGIAASIGLNHRTSFLAALVYMGNKAFFFFHSAYSYETLGILFFLAAWAAVAVATREAGGARTHLVPITVLLAGAAVTHHMSALVTGLSFLLLAVVTVVLNRRAAVDAFLLAGIAIVLLNDWLFLHATTASEYLSAAFTARIDALLVTIRQEGQGTRELFGQQKLWLPERMVGYVYPLVVLMLCAGAVLLLWRRRRRYRPGPIMVTLFICGPLLWACTAPAIVTGGSELAYRSWPFLFLGVAIFAALALRSLAESRRIPVGPRYGAVIALVAAVIAGGIVVGDNEAGRFPRRTPLTAAGPESITADSIAAARWLGRTVGRNHRFVADNGSELVFATYGDQRTIGWGNWLPFMAKTPADAARRLRDLRASYVVVDRRISLLPPRYGYYFGQEELFARGVTYKQPFPARRLRTFDRVRTRSRIYDNGTIAVYGPVKRATVRGARP
jgi:hypothetical protein